MSLLTCVCDGAYVCVGECKRVYVCKFTCAVFIAVYGITATSFQNLAGFIFVCGCFTLLPLLIVQLIPTQQLMEEIRRKNLYARDHDKVPPMFEPPEDFEGSIHPGVETWASIRNSMRGLKNSVKDDDDEEPSSITDN